MTTTRDRITVLFSVLALGLAGCSSELSPRRVSAAAFVIESIAPSAGATGVPRTATVEIRLSATVDRASLGPGLSLLADLVVVERLDPPPAPAPVAGTVALARGDRAIVFTPDSPWRVPEARYRISVLPGIRDLDGQELDLDGGPASVPSEFTTEDLVDVAPPAFGGITLLEVVSSSALRASWELATDDVSGDDEVFYRVYRNDPPARPGVDYGAPAVETAAGVADALLTGLRGDTEYTVGVRAVDGFGNESANAETISARTAALPPDVEPPSFDGIAALFVVSTTAIQARWREADDDRDAPGDIRYRVYVSTTGTIDFGQPLLTTDAGATEVVIGGLVSDTVHAVAVRAVDTSENEDGNVAALEERTLASYSQNVFPILSTPTIGGCVRALCHNAQSRAGGLSLATYDDLMRGGLTRNPPAVTPGDAGRSYIIWRTDSASPSFTRPQMPSGRPPLSRENLDALRRWIDQGALNN